MNPRVNPGPVIDVRTIPIGALWRGADAGLTCADTLFRSLPEARALPLALPLGFAIRWAQKRRTLEHMKAFLRHDDWTRSRWEELWRSHLTHLGHILREVIFWNRLPREQILDRVTVEGKEHVEEALRHGRGAMVLTNHLGNFFSLAPAAFQSRWNVCSVRNPQPLRFLERQIRSLTRKFCCHEEFIGGGVPAAAARTFRQNALLFLFTDFSEPDERNAWVPFGGVETRVSLGPALLALRHRVPVLCITCERLDAMRHRVVVHPPLVCPRTGHAHADAMVLTREALQIVAEAVRRHPEQWWPWDWVPFRDGPEWTR